MAFDWFGFLVWLSFLFSFKAVRSDGHASYVTSGIFTQPTNRDPVCMLFNEVSGNLDLEGQGWAAERQNLANSVSL